MVLPTVRERRLLYINHCTKYELGSTNSVKSFYGKIVFPVGKWFSFAGCLSATEFANSTKKCCTRAAYQNNVNVAESPLLTKQRNIGLKGIAEQLMTKRVKRKVSDFNDLFSFDAFLLLLYSNDLVVVVTGRTILV